jgi:uncharacterized protein YjbI with pentapeptide repeats
MANPEHLDLIRRGVWNAWRVKEPFATPDLSGADLSGVDLHGALLFKSNLTDANLMGANLTEAGLYGAMLHKTNLSRANLGRANLIDANLTQANLSEADLSSANLGSAILSRANLSGANLAWSNLTGAMLFQARLTGANLSRAILTGANLLRADLRGADLSGAMLIWAGLAEANLADANLTECLVYGASAWGVKLNERTKQQGLIITPYSEPSVTVDNLEVAQFVYLLLHNEKIRDLIDTIGRKGVLLLGRFTEGRIEVLERLREELRKRGYVPIVFNFDKPETRDFTETVRLLAGLSKFVIADITNPKSAPLELQATVPEIMVPFQPIIEQGEKPFAMLQDLWIKHRDWVFAPIEYSSVDRLVETMDAEIIRPAEARFDELVMRRAEVLKVRRV